MTHTALYIDRASQEVLDDLFSLSSDDILRAAKELIPEPDGREHWRVDLWLWRYSGDVNYEKNRKEKDTANTLLKIWLEGREPDIASGREDLGLLRAVFASVIGREAAGA
jgi:hypothetical protein